MPVHLNTGDTGFIHRKVTKKGMRQLQNTDEEKAMMLDIIVDNILSEYVHQTPVEKKFHSRAEKIGYQILTDLESNGFITTAGIQGK